jgi:hypothetical protein
MRGGVRFGVASAHGFGKTRPTMQAASARSAQGRPSLGEFPNASERMIGHRMLW